jgi:hypothetical protein
VTLLSAAAVATAVMATPATLPHAGADVDFNAVTTGPLFRIAEAAGLFNVTIPDVPVLGALTIHFGYTNSDPVNLNNQINDFPFGNYTLGTAKRQPGGTLGIAILAASGPAAFKATEAYRALLSSAAGETQEGYDPLVAAGRVNSLTGAPCTTGALCIQGTNQTNLALLLVNNPGTPNGGLYARFAPLLSRFGIDAVTPPGTSASSTGISLNTALVNMRWGTTHYLTSP